MVSLPFAVEGTAAAYLTWHAKSWYTIYSLAYQARSVAAGGQPPDEATDERKTGAIPGGYRFKIPFDDVFPQECYVISIERAEDYNNGKPKDAVDQVSGLPVRAVQVTDPSAKGKNTRAA